MGSVDPGQVSEFEGSPESPTWRLQVEPIVLNRERNCVSVCVCVICMCWCRRSNGCCERVCPQDEPIVLNRKKRSRGVRDFNADFEFGERGALNDDVDADWPQADVMKQLKKKVSGHKETSRGQCGVALDSTVCLFVCRELPPLWTRRSRR